MTIIKNLTPHPLVMLAEEKNGDIEGSLGFGRATRPANFRLAAELPSEGVARAATSTVAAGEVRVTGVSFPVTRTVFGEVVDLPEVEEDTLLVVSLITANAAVAGGRTADDLLVVGETVRDEGGRIIGCTGFGRV